MTYTFANDPLYVREGDYVQFKFKAPSEWDTTLTVTIKIGDLTQFWSIITIPEDFTPDPFPFERIDPAELDTMYYYGDGNRPSEAIINVSGLTETTQAEVEISSTLAVPPGDNPLDYYGVRIDYTGNGTWDTGSAATDYYIITEGSSPPTVENGARIQIKGRTGQFENQITDVTLKIGNSFEPWRFKNKPVPTNKPEPFPEFSELLDQPLGTYVYTTEILQVNGLFEPGDIFVTNGEFALSSNANTVTDENGYEVLAGVTWVAPISGNLAIGTISNGQYLQLRTLTPVQGNSKTNVALGIASGPGSVWEVTTGNFPSTTPTAFSFPAVADVAVDTLIPSEARPIGGITGLGAGVTVPVELIGTDSSEVKIKINNNSVGVFPAAVTNGDIITLYMRSSAAVSTVNNLTIKVGLLQIAVWQILTYAGPDPIPSDITPPANRINVVPGTYITSAPVTINGINVPVSITSSNPLSTISIDYDTFVSGPREFDPLINTSFRINLLAATNLGTSENTTVTVGTTGALNNPFIWTVTTYVSAPLNPVVDAGIWYSRKTNKFDGYTIGTVLPILKQNVVVGYGDLDGGLNDRYPGFVECDGRQLSQTDYFELYTIIKDTYNRGNESSGNFRVPDYRNRRICGTGTVDSSIGNAVFLAPSNGKQYTEPGAEGGYWYFDKVDPFGQEPLEQIQGAENGTEGLQSDFYSLGTVRVSGTETLFDDIPFTITGDVEATIGPLQSVFVGAPEHSHGYYAAVPESEEGYPMIAWGNVSNGRSMFQTTSGGSGSNFTQLGEGQNAPQSSSSILDPNQDNNNATNIRSGWETILTSKNPFVGGNKNFEASLQAYYGDDWVSITQFILDEGFGTTMTGEDPPGIRSTGGGDQNPLTQLTGDNDADNFEISFYTWFISSNSGLSGANLQGSLGEFAMVFDLRPATFNIENYQSSGGTTLTHSHKITLDPVVDFQTDYTGGNESGQGSGGQYGAGLGNAANTEEVTFTQSDIFMEMTEGVFNFSRTFALPVPQVTMKPQSQAPILIPFNKTKYIIKAY